MSEEISQEQEEIARIRLPQHGEIFGVVVAMLGAGRLSVECDDGLTRVGRIPGKIVKRVWIRVRDIVLVKPWKVQSNERADVVWRYTRTQSNWLKRKGYINKLSID